MDEHTIQTQVGALTVRLEGAGAPAVLWHSLFVDDRSWDRLVPALSAHRRLVRITGPGHGNSGDPGRRYDNAACAEAAAAVLDALDITEPVDWVGNAWGGHVGALFAARHLGRVRTLACLGTPVAALTAFERARTHVLLALYGLSGASRGVINGTTAVLLSAHTRGNDPQAVALVHDCLRRADRRMLRNAVVSVSLRRQDITEDLRRVGCPTLMVTGADHGGFTAEQARAAAGLPRHGTAEIVPDASYLVPLEAPQHCVSLIKEFWACHPASQSALG